MPVYPIVRKLKHQTISYEESVALEAGKGKRGEK